MTSSSDESSAPATASGDLAKLGVVGESLLRTVAGGRLSPSYLFEGADSEVLEEAGRAFAIAVLESGSEPAKRARVRDLVARNAHPDLYVRGKDKATVISVAALGETLEQAHATPRAGRHQVFLIQPAEAMEPEGVARYLNALEEPPEGTVFILLTTRPDRLPNAVLSRVRRVRLPPMAEGVVAARLVADGEDAASAAALARYASGSVTRGRRMRAANVGSVIEDLLGTARAESQSVSSAAERTLATITQAAAAIAEAADGDATARREAARVLLADILHGLSVEARDLAADRPSPLLAGLAAQRGLDVLEDLGPLGAAIPLNVTPAAIVLDVIRRLRRRIGPRS